MAKENMDSNEPSTSSLAKFLAKKNKLFKRLVKWKKANKKTEESVYTLPSASTSHSSQKLGEEEPTVSSDTVCLIKDFSNADSLVSYPPSFPSSAVSVLENIEELDEDIKENPSTSTNTNSKESSSSSSSSSTSSREFDRFEGITIRHSDTEPFAIVFVNDIITEAEGIVSRYFEQTMTFFKKLHQKTNTANTDTDTDTEEEHVDE